MTTKCKLSKQSEQFLASLRVYLFSSGKKEDEVDEIVEELKVHLIDAEEDGKSVEHIIGSSPSEYMESISNEMSLDYKTWIGYMLLFIIGTFVFLISNDLLKGHVALSTLQIIGNLLVVIIFVFITFAAFRYISVKNISNVKAVTILSVIFLFDIILLVGVNLLDRKVNTPIIHFGFWGTLLLGIVSVIFIVAMSIWAKTWILIVVIAFTTLPDYFVAMTNFTHDTQLIASTIIMYGGIGTYVFFAFRNMNAEA